MKHEDKRDIVIIAASLFGMAVGSILDERRDGDKPAARAEASADHPVVSLPALMTASTLAKQIGDSAGVDDRSIARQALVAFGTGLALTYFADFVRKFIPGLR